MTARIEGEYLDRDSLQSSLLREFGLAEDPRRVALINRPQPPRSKDAIRVARSPLR